MPRIQEYNTESEGQGPAGGLDPRVEASAAVGQGIEKLGAAIHEQGAIIHRRQAQAEISAISADLSQKHVDFNQMLQDNVADGSLDINDVKKKLNDWSDEAGQGIQTAEGRDYFNKTAGRMKYSLTQSAMHGQAQVAAAQTMAEYQTSQNARVNQLYQDPSAFYRVLNDNEDEVEARASVDPLFAKHKDKVLNEANSNAAMATLDGWARLGDTGKTDRDGNPIAGVTIAKSMLQQGELDDYLSPKQKEDMFVKLGHFESANEAERVHQEAEAKRQAKAQFDQKLNDNLAAYARNQLSPRQVLDWDLPPEAVEFKKSLIDKIKEDARRPPEVNHYLLDQYSKRVTLPDGDPNKLSMEQVWTDKSMRPADVEHVQALWDNSPEGKKLRQYRSDFMKAASARILQKDMGTGKTYGYEQLTQARQEMIDAESAAGAANSSKLDLYNPHKPGNLYDVLKNKYKPVDPLFEGLSDLNQQAFSKPIEAPPGAPEVKPPDQKEADRMTQMHEDLIKHRARKKTE